MCEHRLASARLAREHVQTWGQSKLGLLDQQQIFYSQLIKHRIGVPASTDGSREMALLVVLPNFASGIGR